MNLHEMDLHMQISILVFHNGLYLRVYMKMIKHHDQKQLREERAYLILQLVYHHAETSGQGLKVGGWRQ